MNKNNDDKIVVSDIRQKIMIVDDEMATLLPLKRSIEAEGYSVIEAVNG